MLQKQGVVIVKMCKARAPHVIMFMEQQVPWSYIMLLREAKETYS